MQKVMSSFAEQRDPCKRSLLVCVILSRGILYDYTKYIDTFSKIINRILVSKSHTWPVPSLRKGLSEMHSALYCTASLNIWVSSTPPTSPQKLSFRSAAFRTHRFLRWHWPMCCQYTRILRKTLHQAVLCSSQEICLNRNNATYIMLTWYTT